MDQEALMKDVVAQVLAAMGKDGVSAPKSAATAHEVPASERVTKADYPLGEHIPDRPKSPTGVRLSDMKYEDVISGKLNFKDLAITPRPWSCRLRSPRACVAMPLPAICVEPASSSPSPTIAFSRCTTRCVRTAPPSRSCSTWPTSSRSSTTRPCAPSSCVMPPPSTRSATASRRPRRLPGDSR